MLLHNGSAVVAGDGSAEYNRLLSRVHEAMATGAPAPAKPRQLIADSWHRLRQRGVRPDRDSAAVSVAPDSSSPHADRLHRLFPLLLEHAEPLLDDGSTMLAIAHADGTIVDTAGRGRCLSRAEDIGFTAGHFWTEQVVGTNAIGTALVNKQPVAVHGAEHYLIGQHRWSCAAAPIRDPWTGVIQGVIDISAHLDQAHPSLLSLASSMARTASLELAASHRRELDTLRSRSAAVTYGLRSPWVVVDQDGWVADSSGVDARRRIALPASLSEGDEWIAPLGEVRLTRIDRGWVLAARGTDAVDHDATALVEIHRADGGGHLSLITANLTRRLDVTPRQADILILLALSTHGLSAAELSARLYGTPERDVTVRAEISRLRRTLGSLIAAAPYRFTAGVVVEVVD